MRSTDALCFSPQIDLNVNQMVEQLIHTDYVELLPGEGYIFIPSVLIAVAIGVTAARYYWGSDYFVGVAKSMGESSMSISRLLDTFFTYILAEWMNEGRKDISRSAFRLLKWLLRGTKKVVPYGLIFIAIAAAALPVSGVPQYFLGRPLLAFGIGLIAMKVGAGYAVSIFEWLDRIDHFFREIMKGRRTERIERKIRNGVLARQKVQTRLKIQTESNPKKQDNDRPRPPENKRD